VIIFERSFQSFAQVDLKVGVLLQPLM
jgi:hypothetical protein